ncbi:MAG: redoxin domain-containing protein [Deltaproteobacteria bacterium]|nr:redoxin domain-containing protein [Deltaproteobacteria bacterium]
MRFFKLLTVYCLLLTLLSACAKGSNDKVEETLIGKPAPDFKLTELHGMEYKLSNMKGKVILLRFWSTRCVSCKEEMPKLEASYKNLKDKGFEILAVNVEDPRDKAMNFVHELKLTYPILLDEDQKAAGQYKVYGIPTSFFIDKNGIVRGRVFGGMDEKTIEKVVMPLLEDKAVTPNIEEKKGIFVPLKDTDSNTAGSAQGKFTIPTYGDFTLTDHNGNRTNLKHFMGKVVIMFFGYTNCPDVCPTGLRHIDSALKLLGSRRG